MMNIVIIILLLPCVFTLKLLNKYNSKKFQKFNRKMITNDYLRFQQPKFTKYNFEEEIELINNLEHLKLLNFVFTFGAFECYLFGILIKFIRPELEIPGPL